jgi:hypothetical protein
MSKFNLHLIFSLALMLTAFGCTSDDDPTPDPDLACDEFNKAGQIVLSDDPNKSVDYVIPCIMNVTAQLVIEPGTVIEFKDGAGFSITGTGTLKAEGTNTDPIIMRSESGQKGAWAGLIFFTSSVNNSLKYVEISDGGGYSFNSNNDRGNVVVYSGGRVTIDNCHLSNSPTFGLNVAYSTSDAVISNNIYSENNIPINVTAARIGIGSPTDDYSGNSKDFFQITCSGNIEQEATMQKLNVPYRLVRGTGSNLAVRADLVIDPGVIVEVDDALEIRVNHQGSLKAIGTTVDSIIFKGAEAFPGYWKSIFFTASQSANNRIQYAVIQDAGNAPATSKGAILLGSNPVLDIRNTAFRDIASCAIHSLGSMDAPDLSYGNLTFNNVAGGEVCHD